MPAPCPTPGLLILHGDQPEMLADALADWLAQHPLDALEEETVLVQSNGMAEWLKTQLAAAHGVSAAVRFEFPGSFLWRIYRTVLSARAIGRDSPLDVHPLAWRVLSFLHTLYVQDDCFAPLRNYLADADDDGDKHWQLSQQIARLFDQYQVFRPDWLNDWAKGGQQLQTATGAATEVPADQLWQPALWRWILSSLGASEASNIRPQLHQQALAALQHLAPAIAARLPRRVILFGLVQLPAPTLQLLAALAAYSQVILAIPNPCRYHWADLIEGRELLRAKRRRQRNKTVDLAAIDPAQLHAYGHPLLAAWGRQSRDFIRQLDAFDEGEQQSARFQAPRIELFTEDAADSAAPLLRRVQARIRDLVPLAEHQEAPLDDDDRSIEFQACHSNLREVEVLHDRLLDCLRTGSLRPRDVVVMVPDIQRFTASIHAVFGSYAAGDTRHIPYSIADLNARAASPIAHALEWLLRLPEQRFALTELLTLLEVPALARRFAIAEADLPLLRQWMQGSGLRWGLHLPQRAHQQLQACGEPLTADWALQRMLMGYATGDTVAGSSFGIEPYAEIGGIQAQSVGGLASLIRQLSAWWQTLQAPVAASAWAERGRALLADFFAPRTEDERAQWALCSEALERWLHAARSGEHTQPIRLATAREAWLANLDPPEQQRPFRSGGVTFCTLVPMRAIPFEVVCLLGMNEGEFPRRSLRSDFDLMQLPGYQRPGDRSRKSDDRQMMLEALLSARQKLYISYRGRSLRDNTPQPPSVLVAQLRDYLRAGWGEPALAARTQQHPLQPFSRRYFEAQSGLTTWAREWRAVHQPRPESQLGTSSHRSASAPIVLARLQRFVRQPVKDYFREALSVQFQAPDELESDDERFALDGLDHYGVADHLLTRARRAISDDVDASATALLQSGVAQLLNTGELPLASVGQQAAASLGQDLCAVMDAWRSLWQATTPCPGALPLHYQTPTVAINDWLSGLRLRGADRLQLSLSASNVTGQVGKGKNAVRYARPDKVLERYLAMLITAAQGQPVHTIIVGRDAVVELAPLPEDAAEMQLANILTAFAAGQAECLPVAFETAMAWLAAAEDERPEKAAKCFDGDDYSKGERAREPCLARCFEHFDDFPEAQFAHWAVALYQGLYDWSRSAIVTLHAEQEPSA